MDKFIILGGDSHLGRAFKKMYPSQSTLVSKKNCDITNIDSFETLLNKSNAKYILNCAAITDIEWCEKNSQKCMEINALAVKELEKLCIKNYKKLIQISSDYALFPINTYGKSKELLEKLLDKNNSLIIRTSFYYEEYKLIAKLMDGISVDAYTNSYFNPVSIYRLVNEIYEKRKNVGLINIYSSKKISKYDFSLLFCEAFGLNKKLVNKAIFENTDGKTKRPFNSFVASDLKLNLAEDLEYFKKYSDFSKVY